MVHHVEVIFSTANVLQEVGHCEGAHPVRGFALEVGDIAPVQPEQSRRPAAGAVRFQQSSLELFLGFIGTVRALAHLGEDEAREELPVRIARTGQHTAQTVEGELGVLLFDSELRQRVPASEAIHHGAEDVEYGRGRDGGTVMAAQRAAIVSRTASESGAVNAHQPLRSSLLKIGRFGSTCECRWAFSRSTSRTKSSHITPSAKGFARCGRY